MAKTEILYKTPLVPGYHRIITKDNASLQYLSYHRLILAQNASYSLKSGDQEIGCMCVKWWGKNCRQGPQIRDRRQRRNVYPVQRAMRN